jgi:rhodanese-related sulfurtransferase
MTPSRIDAKTANRSRIATAPAMEAFIPMMDSPDRTDAISVHPLVDLQSRGAAPALLDVREPEELAICGFDGAIHIPMGEIPARVAELPRDRMLVVVCHHGVRSRAVVDFLRRQGLDNAVNLDGGIDAWAWEIDDSMARYG